MSVILAGITLDDHLALLGEETAKKQAINVVHGFNGGATIQKAPGITAGSILALEATLEDNKLYGVWTWGQIKQFRAVEALGLPVTLSFYGRTYQVVIAADWEAFEPVGLRTEPKADDDEYTGLLTMIRTTG